jgi:hypothetical protein
MAVEKKFRFPKEIPLEEYPSPETFLHEARQLVERAQAQGIVLRVMGPIALHFYFPEYVDLYHRMERLGDRVFTDIDYASYGKVRGKAVPFFQSQGYEIEKRAAMISGNTRHIYFGGAVPMIDVFFDQLSYNHPIEFKNRLEAHPHCIALAELLMQKLQIVQINDKDLKDCMLLLLAAPIADHDRAAINVAYVAKRMSDDWGFYYTATTNLGKVKAATGRVAALIDDQRLAICQKADQILQVIENAPKTGNWQRRAKVGTSKPWYNLVEDWS